MQVGFDTNTILAAPSGAATYFLELLPALLDKTEESDELYVFSADEEDAEPLPFLLRAEKLHGVSAPFGTGKLWRSLRFPAVERLVKDDSFSGRLDVCHSFNPPLMPSKAPSRIVTLHGIGSDDPDQLSSTFKSSLLQASVVITPSHKLADELQRRLLAANNKLDSLELEARFRVIPPAVHERYLEPPKGATVEMLCQRFPFLERSYLLAAGAACEPKRSVPLLAEAYCTALAEDETLPSLVFVASEEEVEAVGQVLQSFEGMDGKLLVMEEVSTEELPALYTGSEFLLHPGLEFTYGHAILEAASIGVPAIVGDGCGALELLGSSLVVPADDTAPSWASAILKVHGDQELRATRIEEAKVRARTTTWGKVAEQHWQIYRSALD